MKNNKNGLIAFALLGLAAGTAAYYLLSTDDGKKQLDKANSAIKDLTKSLKELSKKEAKKPLNLHVLQKRNWMVWKLAPKVLESQQ